MQILIYKIAKDIVPGKEELVRVMKLKGYPSHVSLPENVFLATALVCSKFYPRFFGVSIFGCCTFKGISKNLSYQSLYVGHMPENWMYFDDNAMRNVSLWIRI